MQVGNRIPYFSSAPFQRGYGLGSIFGCLAKSIIPLIKLGSKAISKQVLKGGLDFTSDVLEGKDVKQAATDRARSAGSMLLRQAAKHKRKPPSLIKKKKKKKNGASDPATCLVRMLSLIHPNSSESVSSLLDLFSVPQFRLVWRMFFSRSIDPCLC